MLSANPELFGHILDDDESAVTTPRSLHDWDGPNRSWACHCCNRLNDKMVKKCRTCGRSAAYVPSMHLPLFGTMAKALRREQAIFLLDQRGFEVNATDSENWTPAHLASKYGNLDLLEVLVDRGARLEAQTKQGWKSLHFAAQGGHLECVELLLRKKAAVSCVTKDRLSTPLHVAAEAGFVGVCRRLLKEEVDLEARDMMDRTALHLAADKGHLDVVKALLEGGAKVDVLDHDHWSPRQSAEFKGFMEIAVALTKGHSTTKKGETATQGASAALPPAPWHTEIFAQVRLSAVRQRKLDAIAAAREEAYAKYANIYKDHAAERYARAIEASRQEMGGLEAYRRRVVAASTDAERYRGYVETTATPRDDDGGQTTEKKEKKKVEGGRGLGLLLLLEDGSSMSSDFSASSGNGEGSSGSGAGLAHGDSTIPSGFPLLPANQESIRDSFSEPGAPAAAGKGRGSGITDDRGMEIALGDGAAPEGSAELVLGGDGLVEGERAHVPAATRRGRGGDGGGCSSFVDVVPFNNIRAKYLRPLDDTELSRPYHVAPSPDWRADSTGGSRSLSSSAGSSSTSASTNINAAYVDVAANERTMEAYRKTMQDAVTHRSSKTMNWKERRTWGEH